VQDTEEVGVGSDRTHQVVWEGNRRWCAGTSSEADWLWPQYPGVCQLSTSSSSV